MITFHELGVAMKAKRLNRAQCIVLVYLVSLSYSALAQQTPAAVETIDQKKPIEKALAGDETHSYRVVLTANQLARLTVDQRRTDVSISVFGSDDRLVTKHNVTTTGETESISLVADTATTYRITLEAADKNGPKGSYTLTMAEVRPLTERDKSIVAAERLFSAAMQLVDEQKEDSQRKAIEKFEQARVLSHAANDPGSEARSLYKIAHVSVYLREAQKALEICQRALPLAQAAGDRQTQAYLVDAMGSAYDALGDKKKSLEFFQQALSLRDNTDRVGRVNTLNNIGIAYGWMGEAPKAIEYFTQVLALVRELGNRRREATILNNLCVIHTDLGEYAKAIQLCNESVLIRRDLKDDLGNATVIGNLGNTYSHLGEYQKALDSYLQSLALNKTLGERDGEAVALNNVGWVYGTLGEYDKASEYYDQSLKLIEAKGDKFAMATALGNIGVNHARRKDYNKALEIHLRALELSRVTNNLSGEGLALGNIGNSYSNLGDKQKAREFYAKSLEIHRKLGNPRQLATILRNIGELHMQLAEYQKALDYFNEAVKISRSTGEANGEGAALSLLAQLESKRGNLKEALGFIEQALATAESLRINVKSAHLRSSYFATVRKYYELNMAILMDLHTQHPTQGFDGAALRVSEKSRARSLLGLLKEARAEIRQGIDPSLLERERKLRFTIADQAARQTRLLSGKHTDEQQLKAEKEIADLTAEYEQVQAQIRATSPRYAALIEPVPLDLKQIQTEVLDNHTLLLEYSLGEERSFVWAVTTSSLKSVELPKRTEIEGVARQLYEAVTAGNQTVANEDPTARMRRLARADADYHDAAARLSRMILGPVASELKNKRLLIVSEGILQYVPFAALPSPQPGESDHASTARIARVANSEPLIARHEIVNLQSASVLELLRQDAARRKLPTKTLIVLADPVFSEHDERIASRQRKRDGMTVEASASEEVKRSATESGLTDLVRLRFSRLEADEISKLADDKMKMKALDFAANRTLATNEQLGQYRIVHFATHGLINNRYPELSGVVLSLIDDEGRPQNGFLRLYDIYNLKLNADLVVLSACQTALGKEVRGEGIVGLTRGFMYAGSSRVVASLWQTDDRATAELMQRFYRLMLGQQLRPAAALRAAQTSMLRERRWQSPRYWAAFTLQGEWK